MKNIKDVLVDKLKELKLKSIANKNILESDDLSIGEEATAKNEGVEIDAKIELLKEIYDDIDSKIKEMSKKLPNDKDLGTEIRKNVNYVIEID